MSASKCGDDNRSDNTAISLQRADPKEGEGNVRPLSLAQQIFSDPEAINLLRQALIVLHTRMVSTEPPRLKAPSRSQTLPERSRLTRETKMTPLCIPRRLKGQEGRKTTLTR